MDNKKYISVEDAIKTTWMILDGLGYALDENPQLTEAVLAVFDTAQTTDVRPAVRAKWKVISFMTVQCTNCRETFHELEADKFCPNCGAMMEET